MDQPCSVEGGALLLVWDMSFQEVLGSRHRQGYVTVDCFDIHVLETLKVGVLRYSGIFLASTSSWAWAWHVFRVGISPHLVSSPVSQHLPRRPSGQRVFDRKMPLWNNVAPPLCFDSCLLFPRARPKNQWSNVCTKLPTPLPTPLRLLTSRPASAEHDQTKLCLRASVAALWPGRWRLVEFLEKFPRHCLALVISPA